MARTLAAVALLVATALAGCVGDGAATQRPGGVAGPGELSDDESGTLRGVVVNEELAPIAGARVTLLEITLSVNTSQDGSFVLARIPPGSYQLFVDALGYQAVGRKVDIAVGENEPLRITLEILPVVEPYIEFLIKRGYSVCDVNAVYLALTLAGCESQGKATLFEIPVTETWRYGVVELVWQTAESFNLVSDNDDTICLLDNSNPCFVWKIGRSPMRFDARPNDQNFSRAPDYLYPAEDWNWVIAAYSAGMLQQEIQASGTCLRQGEPPCGGVGMSLGIRFEVFISIFHHEEPVDPAAYSGRPDA